MGEEAGNWVDKGIMEGPEHQVRRLGFLRQMAGGLLPGLELSFKEWQWGKMGGGEAGGPRGRPWLAAGA